MFAGFKRPELPSVGLAEGGTSGRRTSDDDAEESAPGPEASGVHPQSGQHAPTSRRVPQVGDTLLAGRFELRAQLGRGGMGVVYEAYDRDRKGLVALKTLEHVDAFAQNRLKDEFRVLADVVHPNLAELYGLFSDGDLCFFTMELVVGQTFRQHVLGAGPPTSHVATTVSGQDTASLLASSSRSAPPSAVRDAPHVTEHHIGHLTHAAVRELFAQLAEGVHAIHEAGKLHRDLKPPNVLVSHNDRVVVLDFGLVRDLPEEKRSVGAGLYAFPENPGMVWGTPEFMAPEQAAGRETTRASDWYAFGVMFYEVLTGQLPFVGDSEFVMTQKRLSAAPDPAWFATQLPQDLAQLCAGLLAIDPYERPGFAKIMQVLRPGKTAQPLTRLSLAAPQTTILLGRDAELDALQRAFERVRAGQPSLVWIEAPSGMGKTALVHEFVTRLRLCEDAAILSGRCHEREQLPYKALDTVVDQLARYLRQLSETRLEQLTPPDVADLVRAFAALGTVFPDVELDPLDRPSVESSDARESRRRAFKSLKHLLLGVSRLRPLVLLIDDLQWGDLDSVRVLEELLTAPDRPALLLIGAYRSEERTTQPFLHELVQQVPARVGIEGESIVLKPLPEGVALELAQALLPPEQARGHASKIVREAAGNPFFLEALAQHHVEAGGVATAVMDVSVDGLVRERCAQLPAAAQRLLSVLAVAGQPIEQPVAFEAAGLTTESHAAVTALRNGRFARTRPGLAADEIEPYHDRVRESVYAVIAPAQLRDHHAALARVLEATGRAEPELLSRHLHGAGDLVRASDFAVIAADQAASAFAFDRAAEFYRRALDYHAGDRERQRTLQVRLGEMLTNAGRGAPAAAAFTDAAQGLTGYASLDLQRRAAAQWLASGRIPEGMTALQGVLRAVDLRMPESPRRALVELLWLRTRLRLRGTRFKPVQEGEIPPDQLLRIDACRAAAWVLGVVDQIQGALFQTKQVMLALDAGEPSRVALALAVQSTYLAGEGAPMDRCEVLLQQAERLMQGKDDPYAWGVIRLSRGTAAALTAHYSLARVELQTGEQMLRERCQGANAEINNARLFWSATLNYLGRWRELNERLEGWLADANERGDLFAATTFRLNEFSTLLWLAADDPETARRDVREAMTAWPHRQDSVQGFYSHVLPVYVELYVGDCRAAQRRLDAFLPGFYRSLLARLKGLRAPLELLAGITRLGMLKERHGDRAEHLAGVRRHLRYLSSEPVGYAGVFAAMLQASLTAYESSEQASIPLLQQALERSDALHMTMLGACLRHRLGQVLGGDQGRALCEVAAGVFSAEGVRRPESLVTMFLSAR